MTLLKENTSLETEHRLYAIFYLEKKIQDLESSILNVHSNNVSSFCIQLGYPVVTKNFDRDDAFCPIFSR